MCPADQGLTDSNPIRASRGTACALPVLRWAFAQLPPSTLPPLLMPRPSPGVRRLDPRQLRERVPR